MLRVLVAFGLNALFNRSRLGSGEWSPWDSSNARDFIKFTVEHGIAVEAWELGNQKTLTLILTLDQEEVYCPVCCYCKVSLQVGRDIWFEIFERC